MDPVECVEFEWDEVNEARVRQCAAPSEVEDAVRDDDRVRVKGIVDGEKRSCVMGRTSTGRLLVVMVIHRRKDLIRVLTVRDPYPAEEEQYRISYQLRATK